MIVFKIEISMAILHLAAHPDIQLSSTERGAEPW